MLVQFTGTFKFKRSQVLDGDPQNVNGTTLRNKGNLSVVMTQKAKLDIFIILETHRSFSSQRAMVHYSWVTCSMMCVKFQLLTPEHTRPLKCSLSNLLKWSNIEVIQVRSGLKNLFWTYVEIDTMKLVVLTDATISNARGIRSQLEGWIHWWLTWMGRKTFFIMGHHAAILSHNRWWIVLSTHRLLVSITDWLSGTFSRRIYAGTYDWKLLRIAELSSA